MGILAHKVIKVGSLPHTGAHAARWAPYSVAGKMGEWVFISVYGYPTGKLCAENLALHQEVAEWVASKGDVRVVVGGDWQVDPAAMAPNRGKVPRGMSSILGSPLASPPRATGRPRLTTLWTPAPPGTRSTPGGGGWGPGHAQDCHPGAQG